MVNLCDPCSGEPRLYRDNLYFKRSLLSLLYSTTSALVSEISVPSCEELTEICKDDWEFRRAILTLSCALNTQFENTGGLFPEKDPLFSAWLATPPKISTFVNDAGYITAAGAETDPVFTAWLAGPPNVSEFTNDEGYLVAETDPWFNAWLATNPLSGYVPYVGATGAVNLGVHSLTTSGNVIIDSDTNGLELGADQDVLLYASGPGALYLKPTAADTDLAVNFFGTTNSGVFTWMEDEDYFQFGDDIFIGTEHYYFNGTDTSFYESGDDVHLDTPANKTLVLDEVVYDDVRVTPGSFDRPGSSDPVIVVYAVGGGGVNSYLYEFSKNNIASFTLQIPHSYKQGEDIKVHVHWTPGPRGVAEAGNTVGWKVDYSWANINGTFGAMGTADLSDACDGTDHKHQMTPEVTLDGHTAPKNISSMLICNIKRTDTGADDTWAGTLSGQLPMLLEIDFHFPIDTCGSRDWGTK